MDLLEVFKNTEDVVRYPAGSTVFTEGESGDLMYVLLKGELRISLRNEPVRTAIPGELVGEMALLKSTLRSATATAVTDSLLAPIDEHSFKLLIQHTPDFALHVMNELADRLRELTREFTS
jgi:CRP/FNR family cyclic AMP-dependent transcriptional regulator